MKREELRFECLKLAHHPGLNPEQVKATALLYERFVTEAQTELTPPPTTPSPGEGKKLRREKPGNPDILS